MRPLEWCQHHNELPGPGSEIRCIVCGCTEYLPCWGHTNNFGQGLCSACATKPVEEIGRRLTGVVA